ncbi:MAG: ABC transporter ATP-binding protein [Halobacteriales archaeon]|nr:ABC transporter ATP-binding protein [Halobacteriales archaeon]
MSKAQETAKTEDASAEAVVEARDLTKRYGDTTVFESLNAEVRDGELLCLLGPSGCGKTTLLHLIAGLEEPTDGDVVFDGETVDGPDYRRGVVFQDPHLYPWRTVRENIEFGPDVRGEEADEKRVDDLIRMIGLEEFEDAKPSELSGGMAQRVSLARTLANDPELLLLDEPFSALDALTKMELQNELLDLMEDFEVASVFVTHDIEEAVYLGDRVAVMGAESEGIRKIVETGDERDRDSAGFSEKKREVFRLFEEEIDG